jgi:hypothetical protein
VVELTKVVERFTPGVLAIAPFWKPTPVSVTV